MKLEQAVQTILAKTGRHGGLKRVYFVGCGGSLGGFYPAQYLMEHASKTLRTTAITSNEFVHATPDAVDANSLVVGCSMRGTPETVQALRVARQRGAATLAYYVEESGLLQYADAALQYGSLAVDETRVEDTNASMQLRLCFHLLHQLEASPLLAPAEQGFAILDGIYRQAVGYCRPSAAKFAAECKGDSVVYVLGSGPSMGAAYVFSICNLMEMQWVHSPTVNSAELLHGPFECVDKSLPLFVLLSEGRTRPVDERALRFLQTYGERLYVLDARALGINRIDARVAEYFNHLLFSSLLNNVYLRQLSYARGHNYLERRYMWQVDY